MRPDPFAILLEQLTQPRRRWATPGELAKHLDPRTVQTPALDLIDTELVRLLDTPDSRLIISMPPQEGKSVRCSRDLPVWALTQNPDLRIIVGSYAQGLANRSGRSVRNAVTAHPDLGITIAADHAAASEWSVAGHDGGVLSVGRGAGVTGRPADLLIIDDPIKDRAEADSLTIRDTTWDWWTDALSARLSPGAPVVVITTRWHEDDLPGRLMLDQPDLWRVLNIPAQCEDPSTDPLGRAAGEFMVSARGRTQAQWELRKETAGPRAWAALYQGRPSPAEGSVFKRDRWARYDQPPWLETNDGVRGVKGGRLIQSWDLAFKGTNTSDFVVGQVWWQRDVAEFWLLDQVRGRWTFSETCDQIINLSARWPQATAKLVEDKANGPAVIDALKGRVPGLIPVNPQGGKEARASAVEPLVAAGNVHLPTAKLAPWVSDLIEEAAAFPNATSDDQVDSLTQALTYLAVTQSKTKTGTRFYNIG